MAGSNTAEPHALLPAPPRVYRWAVLIFISVAMFGNYYLYDSIAPIADLLKSGVTFVNRQLGSGTRLIIDLLLDNEGVASSGIRGFDNVELTHAAVAAYIASGKADAGLGVEAAARAFGLDFVPLLSERYFFLCAADTLRHPQFAPIVALLQTNEFKSKVNALPGYGAEHTGEIMTLAEAFEALAVSA